jgi:hypothetical protein
MARTRIRFRLSRLLATKAFLSLSLIVPIALAAVNAAAGDPIPLIDVVVEKVPPGNGKITYPAKTDSKGLIRFRSLPEGRYVVTDASRNKRVFVHQGGPVSWLFTGERKR